MDEYQLNMHRLQKEVEHLTAEFEHVANYTSEVEWKGERISLRELCQRAISRYQLAREEEIAELYGWRHRDELQMRRPPFATAPRLISDTRSIRIQG